MFLGPKTSRKERRKGPEKWRIKCKESWAFSWRLFNKVPVFSDPYLFFWDVTKLTRSLMYFIWIPGAKCLVSVITFLSPNSSHISWWLTFEGNHYSNALFSAISIFNIGLSGKSFPSLFPGRVLMVQRRLALTKGNQNHKFQGMSVLTSRWNLLFLTESNLVVEMCPVSFQFFKEPFHSLNQGHPTNRFFLHFLTLFLVSFSIFFSFWTLGVIWRPLGVVNSKWVAYLARKKALFIR